MDIFAAGVMQSEMPAGERLRQERDPMRALQRAVNEDLSAPTPTADAILLASAASAAPSNAGRSHYCSKSPVTSSSLSSLIFVGCTRQMSRQ